MTIEDVKEDSKDPKVIGNFIQRLVFKNDFETIMSMGKVYDELKTLYIKKREEQEIAYYRIENERRKRILESTYYSKKF